MRATVTIDEALEAFLEEQRERLSPKAMRNYDEVVFLLRSSLNSYAYDSLDEVEQRRWRKAFDDGDEEAFTKLYGPDKIVGHLGEFLGYFMVRKVMAGEELLRASGTVAKKLASWLHEHGYITDEQRKEAAERGTDAAHELPKADRLGHLLHLELEKTPRFDPDDVPEEHWVEDFLAIERVEPEGALVRRRHRARARLQGGERPCAGRLGREHRARPSARKMAHRRARVRLPLSPIRLREGGEGRPGTGCGGTFWPGLEIVDGDRRIHGCDILLAQGGYVTVWECRRVLR